MTKKDVSRIRQEVKRIEDARRFMRRAGMVFLLVALSLFVTLGITGELPFLISGVLASAAGIFFTHFGRR